MRRLCGVVAAMAVLCGSTAGPVVAAQPAVETHEIQVRDVPTGPAPHLAYLTGRLLHTPSGNVVGLPFPMQHQDALELLGRGPDGWIVDDHHAADLYEVAANGMAHLLFHYTQDGGDEGRAAVSLSSNEHLIAIGAADGEDSASYTVYDLSGFVVGTHSRPSGRPLAFRGRSLYLPDHTSVMSNTLQRWTMGHAPVDTGWPNVVLLDLSHHLFLRQVRVGCRCEHLTGVWLVPTWRPHRGHPGQICLNCRGRTVQPTAFSPDGTSIAFRHATDSQVGFDGETIRDTDKMKLRTVLQFDAQVWTERWEDPQHLLVEVIRQSPGESLYAADKAVLRCDLTGSCVRVTLWQRHFVLDYAPPGRLQ